MKKHFLARRPGSPHENGRNYRYQNGTNAEGYERPFYKKQGPIWKKNFLAEIRIFGAQKKAHLLRLAMF